MNKIGKIVTILMVLIWMGVVFLFSAEVSEKSQTTSDVFTQKIFGSKVTKEQVKNWSFTIRKSAHFILYTVGGILISLCAICYLTKKCYLISFFIGTVYAMTDELHQLFVKGRSGQITDVLIDSVGILLGISMVKWIQILIKKAINRRNTCQINKNII